MLTDKERKAIANHVEAIERYEDEIKRERERLAAPYQATFKAWWDRDHSPDLVAPSGSPAAIAHMVWRDDSDILNIQQQIFAGVHAYEAEHPRPDRKPWDTPRKILAWIDNDGRDPEPGGIADPAEVAQLRRLAGLAARSAMPDDLARGIYREARRRVLALAPFAPSVREDFREAHDPVIGLQDIRMWCEQAQPTISMVVIDQKRKRGRQPNSNPDDDRRLYEQWQSVRSRVGTYKAFASELRQPKKTVEDAIHRHQQRLNKARQ